MDFYVEVGKLVSPLIAIAVSAAVAFAAEYLRQKSKNEVVDRAISSVEIVVRAAVLEAQQTVVDNLKEQNGGKLNDEDKERIKSDVLKAVKERLTRETLKQLEGVTSDLEGYLSGLIESYVHVNKHLGKP